MTQDAGDSNTDPPDDPLERAIYDWLDPTHPERSPLEGAGAAHLRGADRERLRHLIDESRADASGERPTLPALPFERLGPYRLRKPLGAGGFAHVYLAVDERNDHEVAIKLLRRELVDDPREIERFRREASAARRVDHRNCVRVLDAGEFQSQPYLVLEIIAGDALDANLRQLRAIGEPLDVARAVRLGIELCEALQAIHQQGLVHRDVKPGNIRLTPEGRVVLVDFGLATGRELSALTRTGEFVGSLPYAPPEQVLDSARDVGPHGDIYSLGATLYECLTGQTVFTGASAQQLVLSIANDEPLAPQRLNPKIPRDLALVLLKALEKNPARRYATATDLGSDLIAVRDKRPVKAKPRSRWRIFAASIRRRPLLSVAIALIAVGGFALPLALLVQQRAYATQLRAERDRAEAQRLAAQSRLEVDSDPALATLLALESIDRFEMLDGRNALTGALDRLHEETTIYGPWQRASAALPYRDESAAILLTLEGDLYSVELATGAAQKFASGLPTFARMVLTPTECLVSAAPDRIARHSLASLDALPSFEIPTERTAAIAALTADASGRHVLLARGKELVLLEDGVERFRCATGNSIVRSLVLAPDGSRGFAATTDGKLLELDCATASLIERLAHEPAERPHVAISGDGRTLAVETGADVVILALPACEVVRHLAPEYPPLSSLALDSTGKTLMVARSLDVPQCIEVATGKPELQVLGHHDQIRSVAFLERSRRLLTCGSELDSTLRVYSRESILDRDVIYRAGKRLFNVFKIADGTQVLLFDSGENWIERVDLRDGRLLWHVESPDWKVDDLAAYPGMSTFITRSFADSGELRSLEDGSIVARFEARGTDLPVVQDPLGRGFLVGRNGTVSLIDSTTGAVVSDFANDNDQLLVDFKRDGDLVFGTTRDSRLLRVDAQAQRVSTFVMLEPGTICLGIEFDTHRQQLLVKAADQKTFALTFSVRSLVDGRLIESSPPITSHLWGSHGLTPDFAYALDSFGPQLNVRSRDSGELRTVTVSASISSAAVSSDSTQLAIGAKDGSIRIVALPSLEVEYDLRLHRGQVMRLFFVPGTHELISVSDDGMIRRSDVSTLVTRARSNLPRGLTASERALFGLAADSRTPP